MAVTTAALSGNIKDLGLEIPESYLSRVILVIEANTAGSLLRDTSGNTLLAGAKRVTVDRISGTFSQTLVTTDSADVQPADDRLYKATLIYPSGKPGAKNELVESGWFPLTADASLASKWGGIQVTAVSTALYESISMSVASASASATTAASAATSAAASATLAQTLITSDLGTTDGQTWALLTDPNSESGKAIEQVFNIRRFGAAVGNTAAANQAAIQDALDAAGVSGGTVYVPPGTFLHNDALEIPSNVHVRGSGIFSILKATSLVDGGAGIGHRQLDATSKTGFRITDLMLDASEMTVFTSGMRSVLCQSSTDYSIDRCHFRTPGAAVASIACSDFVIDRPVVDIIATDGVAHHDGIIDQWAGSHDFTILHPVINGNGIGKYGVLITGEDTAGAAAACYDFTIVKARVYDVIQAGVLSNGRSGINHDFTIDHPTVDGVELFHGVGIADSTDWTLIAPRTKNTGQNGVRIYSETAEGGVTGGRDGVVIAPVVKNANLSGSTSGTDGAAVAVTNNSDGVVIANPRVSGTTHTYAVTFGTSVTNPTYVEGRVVAGTLGKVNNDPHGGTYTPTVTSVANVTATSAAICRWSRRGDVVTVHGRISVTPTAGASTVTTVGIALPVASDLASATNDLSGTAATKTGVAGGISADVTNDRAELEFLSPGTTALLMPFSFSYTVL